MDAHPYLSKQPSPIPIACMSHTRLTHAHQSESDRYLASEVMCRAIIVSYIYIGGAQTVLRTPFVQNCSADPSGAALQVRAGHNMSDVQHLVSINSLAAATSQVRASTSRLLYLNLSRAWSINSLAAATSQGMPMFLEDWSHVSHTSDVCLVERSAIRRRAAAALQCCL